MHLRDRGCVYAPYAPCLSTPLVLCISIRVRMRNCLYVKTKFNTENHTLKQNVIELLYVTLEYEVSATAQRLN